MISGRVQCGRHKFRPGMTGALKLRSGKSCIGKDGSKQMDPHRNLKDAMRRFYEKNVRYHDLIHAYERSGYTHDGILSDIIARGTMPGRKVRVVDVALGTGYYLGRAKEEGAFACGIDLSINACRMAREKEGGLPVCRSDAESLPFRNGVFDVALCLQLLEHTPYPEKVVGEIARVLRTGGYLFLSAPNMLGSSLFSRTLRSAAGGFSGAIKNLRELPTDLLERLAGAASAQDIADLDACNRVTVFQAFALLRAHGFVVERCDTLRHPKKYRPARYMLEKAFQRLPVMRFTGVNFKIIARKR